MRLFSIALLAALTAFPAFAEQVWQDEIILRLSVEEWVDTETAKIVVSINAAGSGSDAISIRSDMLEALDDVAPDAEWRFTRFDRSVDRAGLENWNAMAEARLTDRQLDGAAERADRVSKPGLQIRIQRTDFEPTLADVERVRAELRARVYSAAREEVERLNAVLDDADFRIATVAFVPKVVSQPRFQARAMSAIADMAESAAPAVVVSNKLQISAEIVLARPGPSRDGDED